MFRVLNSLTVGALLAGRISDHFVVTYRARRGGVWCPEDRLRITLYAACTLVPLSVLFFGLCTQFVSGNLGLALNLVCLSINGFGVVWQFLRSWIACLEQCLTDSNGTRALYGVSG
jgi:hypothetical protein